MSFVVGRPATCILCDGAVALCSTTVALCSADLCDHRQRKRKLSSSQRMTSRDNYLRRESPRMTDTRNSKVRCAAHSGRHGGQLIGNRHPDSMDRAKWHRHGPQLSRARGLRQHMVRNNQAYTYLEKMTLMHNRDFVNEVQSRLQALAQGRPNLLYFNGLS
jgi:hypothetical protein